MSEAFAATWQIVYEPAWPLFTEFKEPVAGRSERLVVGQRGPYVEFLALDAPLFIPELEGWRVAHERAYYVHYRTQGKALVKVYLQKRPVNYADYRPGRYYISPFDLYTAEGKPLCRFQGAAGFMARLL